MTLPLVSICIPTYNGELYIADCISSAINQTYKNLEIIISDDNSTDKVLEIIETYRTKTSIPIQIYKHVPSGIGANWNNCVKKANGDFIKFLFQDDILKPNCITKMVELIATDSQLALVYARRDFIYEFKTEKVNNFIEVYGDLHMYWKDFKVIEGVLPGEIYLKDKAFLNSPKNKIGEPSGVLINRECFNRVGYFNETMKQALDCEFWYRLMPYYKIGFIDDCLSSFRLHERQASKINKSQNIDETSLLYYMYYKRLFRYLHNKNKWKLVKRFNPMVSFLVSIKHKFTK